MRIAEKSFVFKEIIHYYSIRRHSYIASDRVFGNIEKEHRKMEALTLASQYCKVLNKFRKCLALGKDWKLYDVKINFREILKKKRPFKMQEVRVLE